MRVESESGPVELYPGDIAIFGFKSFEPEAGKGKFKLGKFEGIILDVQPYVDKVNRGYIRMLVYDFDDLARVYFGFSGAFFEDNFAQSLLWTVEVKHRAS